MPTNDTGQKATKRQRKWRIHRARTLLHIIDEDDNGICTISVSPPRIPERHLREEAVARAEANAAAIVTAVNGYDRMREALEVAQRWLANSVPTVELDGPKPLALIADALAQAGGGAKATDSR